MLIDVDIADGRVWIRYAEYFARPLRLTPAEGLALLAAGPHRAGHARRRPQRAPGPGPGQAGRAPWASTPTRRSRSTSGPAPEGVLADAARRPRPPHRQVEIDYYSFGRDELDHAGSSTPTPSSPPRASGTSPAWCHRVDDERLFRVDRIARRHPPRHDLQPRQAAPPRARRLPARGPTTPGSPSSWSPPAALGGSSSTRWRRSRSGDGGRVRVTLRRQRAGVAGAPAAAPRPGGHGRRRATPRVAAARRPPACCCATSGTSTAVVLERPCTCSRRHEARPATTEPGPRHAKPPGCATSSSGSSSSAAPCSSPSSSRPSCSRPSTSRRASMAPTLKVDDRVLVNKLSYDLHDVHRGDIVVFERPPQPSGPRSRTSSSG